MTEIEKLSKREQEVILAEIREWEREHGLDNVPTEEEMEMMAESFQSSSL